MTSLRFIDSNPATDAFQRGQQVAQQQAAADLAIEHGIVANAEQLAGAPSRLRTVNANADSARANADVAQGTVKPRISQAHSSASSAATAADVARQTAPYTVDNAYQGNRVARTNANTTEAVAPYTVQQAENAARSGQAGADVAVATVPDKIVQSGAGARSAVAGATVAEGTAPYTVDNARSSSRLNSVNATVAEKTADSRVRVGNAQAAHAEMEGFYKSLDLLNAGQTDAAMQVAEAYGQTIPPEVINNTEVRAAITKAVEHAKSIYPNRPRDQQAFIQGFIKDMAERQSQGQQANDPTAVYNVPDAPQPPELAAQNPQAQRVPSDVQTAEWLMKQGIAPNATVAWEMVRQSRANPAAMRAQIFNNALRSTFGDQAKAKQITDEFMQQMGAAVPPTAQPAPARPAAAPAAAAAPPRPATVPLGSAYSPSRKQWRSPDGKIFNESGAQLQ